MVRARLGAGIRVVLADLTPALAASLRHAASMYNLHGGLGIADDVAQVTKACDEGAYVVLCELSDGCEAGLAGVAGQRGGALSFDLAGPLGDGLGVGPGVERGLVAGEPRVAIGDEGLGVLAG